MNRSFARQCFGQAPRARPLCSSSGSASPPAGCFLREHSCPAIPIKTMHVAGVIVPQAASADPARRGGRKRSLPSAAFRRETKAASGPRPVSAPARNPMRANAMAVTPRGRVSSATTAATSVPTRRAGIHLAASVQPSNVTIARRAPIVATRALQGALPIRNWARSVPTPREAKVSGKTATVHSVRGRKGIGLIARVRRARVAARSALMRRAGIVLSGIRNFLAARRLAVHAGRARISATVRNVANPSRGRSAMPTRAMRRDAVPGPRAMTPDVSIGRAMIAAAQGVHGSRNRGTIAPNVLRAASVARASLIVRRASGRVMTVRPEIVLASIAHGRSACAMKEATIARVVTMRTTAGFSRSVRRSEGAAPIASAGPTRTAAARGRSRSRRRPANVSQK